MVKKVKKPSNGESGYYDIKILSESISEIRDGELKVILDKNRKEELDSDTILIGPLDNEGKRKVKVVAWKGYVNLSHVDGMTFFNDGGKNDFKGPLICIFT